MGNGLKKVYADIEGRYEVANHLLTLGLDRLWRRRAARIAAERGGRRWIDLCSGTGEMAALTKRFAGPARSLFAADFSMPMLARARRKRGTRGIAFTMAEIDALPFSDCSFDLVTVSFAARNIDRGGDTLCSAFREIFRVLRPGGWFVNLETSRPSNPIVRMVFDSYVRLLVRPLGGAITGSDSGFDYLADSILHFHTPGRLSEILREAGFSRVAWASLSLGAAAIHTAVR